MSFCFPKIPLALCVTQCKHQNLFGVLQGRPRSGPCQLSDSASCHLLSTSQPHSPPSALLNTPTSLHLRAFALAGSSSWDVFIPISWISVWPCSPLPLVYSNTIFFMISSQISFLNHLTENSNPIYSFSPELYSLHPDFSHSAYQHLTYDVRGICVCPTSLPQLNMSCRRGGTLSCSLM